MLTLGALLGDRTPSDVNEPEVVGVTELWLLSGFDDVGVFGDANDSDVFDFLDFDDGVNFVDGLPGLLMSVTSLAFDCSSSLSLPPLSSFNASAASNDLRCIPGFLQKCTVFY